MPEQQKMSVRRKAFIRGIGHFLPEGEGRILTNQQLAGFWLDEIATSGRELPRQEDLHPESIEEAVYRVGLSRAERIVKINEAIVKRTGVHQRYVASPEETVASMGAEAARRALVHAGLEPKEVTEIMYCGCTGGRMTVAGEIQNILGIEGRGTDMNMACAGGVGGLEWAASRVREGVHHVLVVASERMWDILDRRFQGRATNILFGDGAAAAVVSAEGPHEILATSGTTYGEHCHLFRMVMKKDAVNQYGEVGPREVVEMDGPAVLKHAVKAVVEAPDAVFKELYRTREDLKHLTLSDVEVAFLHQANSRIIKDAVPRMRRKKHEFRGQVPTNIDRVGNTSAPSPLILLSEGMLANRREIFGKLVLLIGMGAGMNVRAALVQMGRESSHHTEVPSEPQWSLRSAIHHFRWALGNLVPPDWRFWNRGG